MPVVIDGNNLLHSLSGDRKSRSEVRRAALDLVRSEGMRITVVFDGPPPLGTPEIEHLGRVTVRYSGAKSADAVIVALLPSRRRATEWVVVTDDRALAARVRERGARHRRLAEWSGKKRPARPRRTLEPKLSSHDIADWEAYFSPGEDSSES
jgi:hypothetical protein